MSIRTRIFGAGADDPLLPVKKPKGAQPDTLFSVNVPRHTQRLSNGRGEDRHRLSNEHARITYNGDEIDVELINLSGGGAMVSGAFEPMIWDRVDLHLGNHGTIECVVRWLREGRAGLEFAHETRLDWPSNQVATVLRHVIERTFPHIAFPERQAPPASTADASPPPSECAENDRRAPRHPLIWNATLHHDYQSDPVRIRNISSSGAMIETTAMVRVRTEPLLEFSEAVSVSVTVEWAVGDQVGLRFHTPFDMNLLVEMRPSVAAEVWTPPAYLDPDRKEDDRWRRLSLQDLCEELEGFLKR